MENNVYLRDGLKVLVKAADTFIKATKAFVVEFVEILAANMSPVKQELEKKPLAQPRMMYEPPPIIPTGYWHILSKSQRRFSTAVYGRKGKPP